MTLFSTFAMYFRLSQCVRPTLINEYEWMNEWISVTFESTFYFYSLKQIFFGFYFLESRKFSHYFYFLKSRIFGIFLESSKVIYFWQHWYLLGCQALRTIGVSYPRLFVPQALRTWAIRSQAFRRAINFKVKAFRTLYKWTNRINLSIFLFLAVC